MDFLIDLTSIFSGKPEVIAQGGQRDIIIGYHCSKDLFSAQAIPSLKTSQKAVCPPDSKSIPQSSDITRPYIQYISDLAIIEQFLFYLVFEKPTQVSTKVFFHIRFQVFFFVHLALPLVCSWFIIFLSVTATLS